MIGMEPTSLQGLGTALITPFHSDGSLDPHTLAALVDWQVRSGVDFLVPCGSTGEASTLTEEETLTVVRTVIEAAHGRVPVFAGCTHNSTREAVRRAAALAKVDGLTGILSANPYYSKPSQRGQFFHFSAIAEAIEKPLLLYNIPGRTAANLEPVTILKLAEIPNVVGVKESSGNLAQITELISQSPARFRVFAGDDYLALPVLASGGAGLISVVSNAAPLQVCDMLRAFYVGDWKAAQRISWELGELTRALFSEPNPSPVKALLHLIGKIESDAMRLPMVPVEDSTRARLQHLAASLAISS